MTSATENDFAIRCRDLRKRYKSRGGSVDAVNGLDLKVRHGECFGLLGPLMVAFALGGLGLAIRVFRKELR